MENHREMSPPQAFSTACSPGPPATYTITGYFREESKSGGRIIHAFISSPMCVFTVNNSGTTSLYGARSLRGFSLTAPILLPSDRRRSSRGGVDQFDQESRSISPAGDSRASWLPACGVIRLNVDPYRLPRP